MELDEALGQIAAIRRQMARASVFRGYRAAATAATGAIALAAAAAQPWVAPAPETDLRAYLALWLSAAAASVALVAAVALARCGRGGSSFGREAAAEAAGQFLPALAAGALLAGVIASSAPQSAWMLPGLWAMFFAMGVFASQRLLPPAARWVGVYYLAAGLTLLAAAQGEAALRPWTMGLTFGCGQFVSAAVLFWTLERDRGDAQA